MPPLAAVRSARHVAALGFAGDDCRVVPAPAAWCRAGIRPEAGPRGNSAECSDHGQSGGRTGVVISRTLLAGCRPPPAGPPERSDPGRWRFRCSRPRNRNRSVYDTSRRQRPSSWPGWARSSRCNAWGVAATSGSEKTAGRSRLTSNRRFASGRRPVVRSPNSQRCRDGPRATPHRTLVALQTHAEVLLAVLSFRKTLLQGGRHAFWERPAGARETGARGSRAAHLPGNAGGRSIDRAILRECGDWRGITPISIRWTIFPCGQPNSTAASIGDERRCRATSKRGSVYGC